MATTRTAPKKPAARKPRPTAARTSKPAAAPAPALHGIPALFDRILHFTEKAALRIAVMAKRGRRSLLKTA
jgi:hypothetical protein